MFADDLLMFSRADKVSTSLMFRAFTQFSHAYGLDANLEKSNVYLGGVSGHIKDQIMDTLQVSIGEIFPSGI